MPEVTLESAGRKNQEAARARLFGHLILAAPVFLFYHLGLLVAPRATNGADLITRLLGYLAGLSWLAYLVAMLVLVALYLLILRRLRRKQRFDASRFPRVLVEAAVYAVIMGPLAGLLIRDLPLIADALVQMGPLERLVAAAGAGFYEELVFRLMGIGLLAGWLGRHKRKRWLVLSISIVVTAVLFSAVHYLGPGAEAFGLASFLFRLVLGVMLGIIFVSRGFATAVYAHFFYDLYVMFFLTG